MVTSAIRRFILGAMLLSAVGAAQAVLGIAPAAAAPAPTSVTISGEGFHHPRTVRAVADNALFTALLDQVDWLQGEGEEAAAPATARLGPKYTVVLFVDYIAWQTYDLYPLASGGPRVFRPARQPDDHPTTAAWFFGRLNMSETLRAAGAPLPVRLDMLSGGFGGGERVIPDSAIYTGERIDRLLGDLRRLVLLNGAVVLTITLGLAVITLLVRRRTR